MFKRILKNEGEQEEFFAYEVKTQCASCGHRDPATPTRCNAFPGGIPVGFLMGVLTHPYNFGGVSDGGLRWVPMAQPTTGPEDMFD